MRWTEITEKVGDYYLYHGTSIETALDIIKDDCIRADTHHPGKYFGKPDQKYVYGVSLSRSSRVAHKFGDIVFELDWRKLKQLFPLRQIDHFSKDRLELSADQIRAKTRSEAEEFVVTDYGIKPLDQYIVSIIMKMDDFEEYQEKPFFNRLIEHPKLVIH